MNIILISFDDIMILNFVRKRQNYDSNIYLIRVAILGDFPKNRGFSFSLGFPEGKIFTRKTIWRTSFWDSLSFKVFNLSLHNTVLVFP